MLFYNNFVIYLARINYLCGRNPAQVGIRHVQDARRAQNQWFVVEFDLESVILIGPFRLSARTLPIELLY